MFPSIYADEIKTNFLNDEEFEITVRFSYHHYHSAGGGDSTVYHGFGSGTGKVDCKSSTLKLSIEGQNYYAHHDKAVLSSRVPARALIERMVSDVLQKYYQK